MPAYNYTTADEVSFMRSLERERPNSAKNYARTVLAGRRWDDGGPLSTQNPGVSSLRQRSPRQLFLMKQILTLVFIASLALLPVNAWPPQDPLPLPECYPVCDPPMPDPPDGCAIWPDAPHCQ